MPTCEGQASQKAWVAWWWYKDASEEGDKMVERDKEVKKCEGVTTYVNIQFRQFNFVKYSHHQEIEEELTTPDIA